MHGYGTNVVTCMSMVLGAAIACNAGSNDAADGTGSGGRTDVATSAGGGSGGGSAGTGTGGRSGTTDSSVGSGGGIGALRSCGFIETTRSYCDGDSGVSKTYTYDLCLPDDGSCSTPEGGEVDNPPCYSNWNYNPVYFEGTCDDWHAHWDGDVDRECLIDDHCTGDGECRDFRCICDGEPCPEPMPVTPTGAGGSSMGGQPGAGGSSTAGNGGRPATAGSGGTQALPATTDGSGGSSTAGTGGQPPATDGGGGSSTAGTGGQPPATDAAGGSSTGGSSTGGQGGSSTPPGS